MRKGKWANCFGAVCAAGTLGTIAVASRHLAKKYGQKINNEKIINLDMNKIINLGIDKFLKTDDDELLNKVDFLLNKENPEEAQGNNDNIQK